MTFCVKPLIGNEINSISKDTENLDSFNITTKKDLKKCAQMMAKSFSTYPMTNYLFPNLKTRFKKMSRYFYGVLKYSKKFGTIIPISSDMEGAIVYLPSSKSHFSNWDVFKSGLWWYFFRAGLGFLHRLSIQEVLQYKIYKKHTGTTPHTYFMLLGVDPKHQGKRYASSLLKQMLKNVDEKNQSCYCETYVSKNVEIYKRYGFKVVEEAFIPKTEIKFWGLKRDKN